MLAPSSERKPRMLSHSDKGPDSTHSTFKKLTPSRSVVRGMIADVTEEGDEWKANKKILRTEFYCTLNDRQPLLDQ